MPHDEKICEKTCRFHVLWLTLHRNWDDESWLRGLSYGVMVALQFLVLPVEVRILVRQLTQSGNLLLQISRFVLYLPPFLFRVSPKIRLYSFSGTNMTNMVYFAVFYHSR